MNSDFFYRKMYRDSPIFFLWTRANGAKTLISIFSVISAPISKFFFLKRIYVVRAIRLWHFRNIYGLAKRRNKKTAYQNIPIFYVE